MHSRLKVFLVLFLVIFCFLFLINRLRFEISAQDCGSDLDCQIKQIQQKIDAITPAQNNNKKQLSDLNSQLAGIKTQIANVSVQLTDLSTKIAKREVDLAYTKKIFEEKTADQYRFMRVYDPIMPFLSSDNASSAFQEIILREKVANEDRNSIVNYANELQSLNADKLNLEKNKVNLAAVQKKVNDQAVFVAAEVAKVDSYISELTSEQEQLQARKAGGFATSVGDTPATLEPCPGPPGSSNYCDPGFRPAFAAFSFGAPHRTGMSQYGAYGRSKAGQGAETILSAYFQGASLNKSFGEPGNITVNGYGSVSFEDNYLMGISEVPESWGDNGGYDALKAQAVAEILPALSGALSAAYPPVSDQVSHPSKLSFKGVPSHAVVLYTLRVVVSRY